MHSFVIMIGTLCLVAVADITSTLAHDFKGFDDSILYDIDWNHFNDWKMTERTGEPVELEYTKITTHTKDQYHCVVPKAATTEKLSKSPYTGPAPLDLVATLFSSAACTYRIESYWTYEVCHGNYIKQYHEEREGKTSKLQEYYLGKWDKAKTEKLRERLADAEKHNEKLKYKKIDGLKLPYLELEMSDGTLCDLIENKPRTTKVLYVCFAHGKNEVYSLKEVSTCNYEVVILAPGLCAHPSFKPQQISENLIQCTPFNNAPAKPKSAWSTKSVLEIVAEERILELLKLAEDGGLLKMDHSEDDVIGRIVDMDFAAYAAEMFAAHKIRLAGTPSAPAATAAAAPATTTSTANTNQPIIAKVQDTSPVVAFLQGKNCLTGGFGWWKYEFCYGRYVRQFHVDKNFESSVILGFFDEEAHKTWIREKASRSPTTKGTRTQLSHFYQGGSLCELTGQKRQTVVKLKCMESATSATAVSLYLMEPQTCQYVLGVESPLICDILQKADEYGLMEKEATPAVINADDGVFLGNAVVEDIEVRFEND